MNSYTHILFDLDHTLWDYENNSRETLQDLYLTYNLESRGVTSTQAFINTFEKINRSLWDKYDHGEIDRAYIQNYRFAFIFEKFNIDDHKLSLDVSAAYINECPKKGKLIPKAKTVLDYLVNNYKLSVVTNGFEDVQHTKLEYAGIKNYFQEVITSERAGHRKPSKEIFDFTLQTLLCNHHEAIMVGDNLLTDIAGARKARIDTVYFNPDAAKHDQNVSFEINCLSELTNIV